MVFPFHFPSSQLEGEAASSLIAANTGLHLQMLHLILDLQGVPSCDVSAARAISRLCGVYESVGVGLYLAGING